MVESRVRQSMEEKNFTVRGLAQASGITEKTIMRARGPMIARCTLETLATIATALGVKVKDLFEED